MLIGIRIAWAIKNDMMDILDMTAARIISIKGDFKVPGARGMHD